MNMPYIQTSYKLITVSSTVIPPYLTNPFTWLGVAIFIVILYLIFHKGKKQVSNIGETW